jgi:hypothetical protein
VPPVDEFFKALWTGAFVSVIAVIALNTTNQRRGPGDLADTARREADDELTTYARNRAREAGTDEHLVLAILYTENLQRPPWFRRLEYLKGRLFPHGSYGIMQVTSPRPISDKESIDMAIEKYLRGVQIPTREYGLPDREVLMKVLEHYNDNPAFTELAAGLYEAIKRDY